MARDLNYKIHICNLVSPVQRGVPVAQTGCVGRKKRDVGMKNRMSLPGQALVRAAALLPLLLAAVMFSGCSMTKAEPNASAVVETNSDPNVFTLKNVGGFPLAMVE